jgi:osmotically-inducible protein OsmY
MMPSVTSKLKEKVEAKLRQDSQVKDFPIEVIDNNGVVTLQGEVPSEAVSMTAEGLARQVEGVVNVTNELIVQDPSRKNMAPPFGVPPTQR